MCSADEYSVGIMRLNEGERKRVTKLPKDIAEN